MSLLFTKVLLRAPGITALEGVFARKEREGHLAEILHITSAHATFSCYAHLILEMRVCVCVPVCIHVYVCV